jgi:hypothetical protein
MPTLSTEPLARDFDPVTSHLAAESAGDLQAAHQRAILEALRRGPAGKDLIADRSKLDGVQVARRLVELQRKVLVKPTGRQVPSNTGRLEREWQLA